MKVLKISLVVLLFACFSVSCTQDSAVEQGVAEKHLDEQVADAPDGGKDEEPDPGDRGETQIKLNELLNASEGGKDEEPDPGDRG